jgi:hypothetical protein
MTYEMTPDEATKYGAGLSIWQQLALLQQWAPLIGYGQRLVNEPDTFKRSLVIADACEWLASKTSSPLDDELVRHVGNLLKTKEGEALVRWALLKVEEVR